MPNNANNNRSTGSERALTFSEAIRGLTTLAALSLPGGFVFASLFWLGFLKETVPILMYRGLALATVAAALQLFILAQFWRGNRYFAASTAPTIIAATALAFGFNVSFLVIVPVTVDRSVTVFLLGQLASSEKGMSAQELRQALVTQYVDQYNAVDRRMREQSLSGNVTAESGVYKLTPQGSLFVDFSRFVGAIFGADLRYIAAQKPEIVGTTE